MNEQQILIAEKTNSETSPTKNPVFDENGYLVIRNLWDPRELECPVPELRGQLNYLGKKTTDFIHVPIEQQVNGSVARYWHPQYREIHSQIRLKIEKSIGKKLYNTYYYDRFYFPGQDLKRHTDREACEISVTVHVGTNLPENKKDWPIWIKTPDTYENKKKEKIKSPGEARSVILYPGDGMIYKGCERPHWREPMPTPKRFGFLKDKKEYYYHQIFFHYVLQDGIRSHHAFDGK